MSQAYFISGIDTDAGKSYVTGYLAARMMKDGKKVITQKFIQTGNTGFSEDIDLHRKLMGTGMLPEDLDHTTAPVIFSYPASARLKELYDIVLIEGAGGLMVPVTDDFFTIDYVSSRRLPLMLVTNGVLGSINHTVLSLEAVKARGIELVALLYNEHFDTDKVIAEDTKGFLRRYLSCHFPAARFATIPSL